MSIAPARMIERPRRRVAADREACVVEVTEGSPPTLFHAGETLRLERLPVGSRIVYPPPPLKGLAGPDDPTSAKTSVTSGSVFSTFVTRWTTVSMSLAVEPGGHHAIHRVAAATADAHDLDAGSCADLIVERQPQHVVLCVGGSLSMISHVRVLLPRSGARNPIDQKNSLKRVRSRPATRPNAPALTARADSPA